MAKVLLLWRGERNSSPNALYTVYYGARRALIACASIIADGAYTATQYADK